MQTDVICVDFRRAFHKVSHRRLPYKLERLGISEEVLKWIGAYLSIRQQAVKVENYTSRPLRVYSGVPQGSVLGPFLFLTFVNYICSIVEAPTKMKLFADDCLIYSLVTCEGKQINLNRHLQALDDWYKK